MAQCSFILQESIARFLWIIYSVQFCIFLVHKGNYSWVPFKKIKNTTDYNKTKMKTLFLNVLSSISLICNSIKPGLIHTLTPCKRETRFLLVVDHTESSAQWPLRVWVWLTQSLNPTSISLRPAMAPVNTNGNDLFFFFAITQSTVQQIFAKQNGVN